ncbi:MAG: ribosome small subunit-dependent GTPase A [Bacteroidales bacterium]|nr:ribosome small subunit-dependent GTPase A [Bacteroidales bacterium]
MQGLVTRTTGSWYKVLSNGSSFDCRLRGNYRLRGNKQTNPVAVGDQVEFLLQDDGTGMINNVLDRRNYIVRKATKLSKQTHVIASNIDQLCIVATLALPRTSTGFIDRLLVTAEAYHIPACIIFNKADLYDNELMDLLSSLKDLYERVGYPVLVTSALEGTGIGQLKKCIHGKTVLFSGHSGVGKSALLNAIEPSLNLRMGEVSEWSEKGKHTTTFAEIFPLPSSEAFLIDTPGIKEFGMVDIKPEELGHFFPEIRSRLHGCRFNTCTHTHEPGCAVKEAVDNGSISDERYTNYLGILSQIQEDEA